MNRFTVLFLVFAVLLVAVTPGFAGKVDKKKTSFKVDQTVVAEAQASQLSQPVIPLEPQKTRGTSKVAALSGLYSIGVLNPGSPYVGNYTTLRAALVDLQTNGVSGPTTFEFTDAAYVDSGGQIGGFAGQGPANPVVFQRSSLAPPTTRILINANLWAAVDAGIKIVGGNSITFQGSSGAYVPFGPRPLTIEVDTLSSVRRNVFYITNGSKNIKLKDMELIGWRKWTGAVSPFAVINAFNTASTGQEANITVQNCGIRRGNAGMTWGAPLASVPDTNFVIEGCDIGGGATIVNAVIQGLQMSGTYGVTIRDNNIDGVITQGVAPSAASAFGINFTSAGLLNVLIERNKIHNMERTAGSGGTFAIALFGGGAAPCGGIVIRNNMIYDLRYKGIRAANNQCNVGILDQSGAATMGVTQIYNNTIHMTGSQNPLSPGFNPCVLYSASGKPATDSLVFHNNIFSNEMTNGQGYVWGDFSDVEFADYNLYWYKGAGNAISIFLADLPALQAYYGFDLNSIDRTVDGISPGLVGPTDAHVSTVLGSHSDAEDAGIAWGGLADDFDGQVRPQGAAVDIGADEFVGNPFLHDAATLSVLLPTSTGVPVGTSGIQPVVRLYNNGSTAEVLSATLTLNTVPPTVVTGSASFAPFEAKNVVLTALDPIATPGALTATAVASVSGDGNALNDQLVVPTAAAPLKSLPYSTTFEDGGEADWTPASIGGSPSNWVLGTPAKLGGTHSGTNAWVTKLSGLYDANVDGAVYSPYFDLATAPFSILRMWNSYDISDDAGYDGHVIDFTTDFGLTWERLGALNDPRGTNWYDNDDATLAMVGPAWSGLTTGYVHSELYTNTIGAAPRVQFRVRFKSDGGTQDNGAAFDDFSLSVTPSIVGDVYNDKTNNLVKDLTDPGLAGATITLIRDGVDTVTVVSNGAGHYEATDLVLGTYTVSTDFVFGANTVPGGSLYTGVVVVDGDMIQKDFAFYNPATLSGQVYYDENHNGSKDGLEAGLAGVTVNVTGVAPFSTVTDSLGNYSFTIQEAGAYNVDIVAPSGYVKFTPVSGGFDHTLTFGDAPVDAFGLAAATTSLSFRSASMNDWATAVDAKGKANAIKCKPLTVDFDFNIVSPDSSLGTVSSVKVKLGMVSTGVMLNGVDTVATFSAVKEFTYTAAIAGGDTFQIIGKGTKGKAVKAQGTWYATLATKAKKYNFKVLAYNANIPRLPMPNLINVLSELPSWPTLGNASGASSVIHPKYKDVLKTLNKKGVLHTGAPRCINTFANNKPIAKQQKALPPDKHSNVLMAEVLTLGLNISASTAGKFPTGLGALIYNNAGDTSSATFNGSSLSAILTRANTFLGCAPDTTADAVDYYNVISLINSAFRDSTVDTVSWSCAGVVMTGVRELKDVAFLTALPGFVQPKVDPSTPPALPSAFALNQNYPNPFNPTTNISFELPEAGIVNLKVYNMLGQEVATLLNNVEMSEGEEEVEFDAASLPSGVYFYRLTVNTVDDEGTVLGQSFTQVRKMMLVK